MTWIRRSARNRARIGGAWFVVVALTSACASESAETSEAEAAAMPRVTIVEPADGAEVGQGPIRFVIDVEGLQLAPAGEDRPGTGHLHLFINQPVTPAGEPIPAGVESIVHLGQAQTSFELAALEPGDYTVIAVLGDFVHRTIDPQTTDTARIRVRAR